MREQIARANRESANPKNSPLEHSQASAPRRTAPHRAAPRRIADSFDKMPTAGCGNLHLKTINHIRARDGETGAISVSRSSRRIPLPVAPRKRAARNCRFVVSSVAAGDTQRIPQLCACAREGERQRVKERERESLQVCAAVMDVRYHRGIAAILPPLVTGSRDLGFFERDVLPGPQSTPISHPA